MARAQVVALEYFGGYRVDAARAATDTRCEFLLLTKTRSEAARGAAGSSSAANVALRSDDDVTDIYRRVGAG